MKIISNVLHTVRWRYASISLMLVGVLALSLSACTPSGSGSDWQDANYNASQAAGMLGPSGSIGP